MTPRFKSLLLLAAFTFGTIGSVFPQPEVPNNPTLTTGSRSWHLADGSRKRLRVVEFDRNMEYVRVQADAAAPHSFLVSQFAPEEQAMIASIKNGSVKLVTTPGLAMLPDFPSGKLTRRIADNFYWRGETRSWQRSDGKRVEASLINLNEDDVVIQIQDSAWRMALKDLSPEDLRYIDRLKRGEARMYSQQVVLFHGGWEGGQNYEIVISGERYAALAAVGSDFDRALAATMNYMKSHLKPGGYELDSFEEEEAQQPQLFTAYHAFRPGPEKAPLLYTARFYLKKGGVDEARSQTPYSMSPRSWRGAPTWEIHAMADGGIVEPTLPPD